MEKVNTLKLSRPWDEVKERLKESDLSLTDEDLRFQPGQEDKLLDRLANKMHKSTADVKAWIESASDNTAQAG
jgi:hypothetical protein